MEFFAEYGIFLAKSLTLLVVFVFAVAFVSNLKRQDGQDRGKLEVCRLNDRFKSATEVIEQVRNGNKKISKKARKQRKQDQKKQREQDRAATWVIDFHGDLQAKAVERLREEISAITLAAKAGDEVLVRLESSGGMMHAYGLAASQLDRIKQKGIPLVIAVDKVAASGGYMMACVADRILCAPFAIVGSIGVVAQLPNFNKLLKKHDVDVELHTAGQYKRTLTLFGENTDAARTKFVDDLEDAHGLFKGFVAKHRPQLDMTLVGTGEIWFGEQALEIHLVDELTTSDQYILDRLTDRDVFEIRYTPRKKLAERLAMGAESAGARAADAFIDKLVSNRFPG